MDQKKHWAVLITNTSNKGHFIEQLCSGTLAKHFEVLKGDKIALFSKLELDRFIEEEERHDRKILTAHRAQSLKSMSSGERKKALLEYLLNQKPKFLILDNPFDNLDKDSQQELRTLLNRLAGDTAIIQLASRTNDLLNFINTYSSLEENTLRYFNSREEAMAVKMRADSSFTDEIPPPIKLVNYEGDYLIQLKNVGVQYDGKPILKDINWAVKTNEYWELAGNNGSGKTTLLSLITGDNPKAYGQDITLFGIKKGSGESVWDLKKHIGYFTPAMTDRFGGYHSLENMLISGLLDSIGLYIRPSDMQRRFAKAWLRLIGMEEMKDRYFHDLSMGQQRLVMCARAMIKHPLLLILDEPTAGLDDASALLFVSLVNKIARESNTAIIFVSHRGEPGLDPQKRFILQMTPSGSIGTTEALT